MNAGYGGFPSRRRNRGPLHPSHRATPTDALIFSDAPAESSDAAGKKRAWTSTVRSGGLGSLPWEQAPPSTQPPQSEFSFNPGLSMQFGSPPSSDMPSMLRGESWQTLPSSFSQSNVSMTTNSSVASFTTATDMDPQIAAHGTMDSSGMTSAHQALHSSLEARAGDDREDGPAAKRRRGLAGSIVDKALNAALYTGAAALTAYSLWSTWGRRPEDGNEPDGGPAVNTHKMSSEKQRMPPGALEEPPPPYYTAHEENAGPSTPKTPSSLRTQRVFVSGQRSRRRPTFQTHRAARSTGTSRKAIPDAFRAPTSAQDSPASHYELTQPTQDEAEDDEDEDDEQFQRFQDKMNALIAEGQAALKSKPSLDAMDVGEEDWNSGAGMSSSTSAPHLDAANRTSGYGDSPFVSHATTSGDGGLPQSQSQPAGLHHQSFLPEPVKRAVQTPTRNTSLGTPNRFDFGFGENGDRQQQASPRMSGTSRLPRMSSPFVFGAEENGQRAGNASPSRSSQAASPYSRIPRLQARRGAGYSPR